MCKTKSNAPFGRITRLSLLTAITILSIFNSQMQALAAEDRWRQVATSNTTPVLPKDVECCFKLRAQCCTHASSPLVRTPLVPVPEHKAVQPQTAPSVVSGPAMTRQWEPVPGLVEDLKTHLIYSSRDGRYIGHSTKSPFERSPLKSVGPNGSLPESWRGTWVGHANVREVYFGNHSSFDMDMVAAKKYLVQPGLKGVLLMPMGQSTGPVVPLGSRTPITREPICTVRLDDPLLHVRASDCQVCCGSLRQSILEVEHARRLNDPAAIQATLERIKRRVRAPGSIESGYQYLNKVERQLAEVRQASSRKPYSIPNLEYQVEQQRELLMYRIQEERILKLLTEGRHVPDIKDWYKKPGASFYVHLNQIEVEENIGPSMCSAQTLRNQVRMLSPDLFETDVVIRHGIYNAITGSAATVFAETVMRMKMTNPKCIQIEIAKLIYNERGAFEDRIVLCGTLHKSI